MQNNKNLKLVCGCDTFEVTSTKERAEKIKGITVLTPLEPCQSHNYWLYRYKVNPDKVYSGAGNDLERFRLVLDIVKDCFAGAEKLYISRFDFRFDDYVNPYERLHKLNRMLLSLLVTQYDVYNKFESCDFITNEKLTVRFEHSDAITNTFIAAEYYNKQRQEPSGKVKSRLELRTKQLELPLNMDELCDFESFVLADWLQRLRDVANVDTLKAMLARVSEGILDGYYMRAGTYNGNNEYFTKVQDSIYTTSQLTKLFGYVSSDPSTARDKSYYFRLKRPQIAFYGLADIQDYIAAIEQSALDWLTETDAKAFAKYVG